jgi:two-component system chemotaxis response regulator CheY
VRVLIIDDAPPEREILKRLVREAGHEVAGEADALAAALPLLDAQRVDVAIVDGRLPPNGALEALEALRRERPEVALLVIASLDETGLVRAARRAGATGALQRPLLPSQVAAALARGARTPPVESE